MFDLEKAIAEWRRRMLAAGISAPESLDELESHLREEIEERMRLGLDAQRAFEAAVERVGQPSALGAEFAKLSLSRRTLPLKYLRIFCFLAAPLGLLTGTWTFLEAGIAPTQRILGMSGVTIITFYLGALPFLQRLLPDANRAGVRKAIVVGSFLMHAWIITTLLSSVKIIHVSFGLTLEMSFWWLMASFWATMLAYNSERPDSPPDCTLAALLCSDAFTPMAQRLFAIAREEAAGFCHDFIGTEHLLLGLIGVREGAVAKVLQAMGVERSAVRAEIEKVVGPGSDHQLARALPYTPRSRKVLEIAAREAKALKQSSVCAEHIFLGLVLEGGGVAAKVLKNLGVKAESAREEIRRRMRTGAE
jgi:hypothetical protein